MQEQDTTSLTLLSDASRMLTEAKTFDEVRKIRSLAMAAQTYAKAHNLGLEAQKKAGAVAVEADIRGGEILRRMAEEGERQTGGQSERYQNETVLTLADLGISKKQSAAAQAIAAEADAIRDWMAKAKEVTPRRAARVARDKKAEKKRQAAPIPELPATCDFRLGDFREVLADLPDASIDVILTDPPYPEAFLPLWSDLAIFAKRVLKPSGMLVAMSGQTHLPAVIARLSEHLIYRWTMAYLMSGSANVVHARKVNTMWKPLLVYGSTERRLFDLARSDREDKEHHDWGQSESGMADALRLVADPGAVICDPFVGGGTVPLVAIAGGYSFIGAEIDADAYRKAQGRLAR